MVLDKKTRNFAAASLRLAIIGRMAGNRQTYNLLPMNLLSRGRSRSRWPGAAPPATPAGHCKGRSTDSEESESRMDHPFDLSWYYGQHGVRCQESAHGKGAPQICRQGEPFQERRRTTCPRRPGRTRPRGQHPPRSCGGPRLEEPGPWGWISREILANRGRLGVLHSAG